MSVTRTNLAEVLAALEELTRSHERALATSLRVEAGLRCVFQIPGQKEPPPSVADRTPRSFGAVTDPAARSEMGYFVQALDARVADIIPGSEPTAGMISWARDEGRSVSFRQNELPDLFAIEKAALATKQAAKDWLRHQRKLQHGWAILMRLMKKNPRAAEALRAQYPTDETELLLKMAAGKGPGTKFSK